MDKPTPCPQGAATFRVPLYGGTVVLCVTRDAYQKFLEEIGEQPYDGIEHVAGLSAREIYDVNRSAYLVGVFEDVPGTLVHELSHTTFHILQHSGVPVTPANNEAFAYLFEALFVEAIAAMKILGEQTPI